MFCHKCGTDLAADAEFCHKCGTRAIIEDAVAQAPEPASYTPAPPKPTQKPGNRKVEGLKITSGVIAITCAVIALMNTIALMIGSSFGSSFAVFLEFVLLSAALIVYVVYIFAFYGKKRNILFVISMLLFAGAHLMNVIENNVFNILFFQSHIIIGLLLNLFCGVIVVIIALQYKKAPRAISKGLLIALSSAAVGSFIFLVIMISMDNYYGHIPLFRNHYQPIHVIYYLPFLFLLFGCPPDYKRTLE